jgi:hypothetical protein
LRHDLFRPATLPALTSCKEIFRAFTSVKGRSPPEAARFQRALDGADGSENKAQQEVDGSACRQDDQGGALVNCHLGIE